MIDLYTKYGLDSAAFQNVPGDMLSEVNQRILEMVQPLINDPHSNKAKEFVDAQLKQIEEYKRNRRDAFNIEVFVPYLKASVLVNAETLADVWPFCIVTMLMAIAVLGFQQRSYEIVLSSLIEAARTETERFKQMVINEFFGGSLVKETHKGEVVWLYKRALVLSPGPLVAGGLLLAIVALSFGLLARYNPTHSHPTGSILFSYYSLIWCFLVVSLLILRKTYVYYDNKTTQVLEGTVRSARFFRLQRSLERYAKASRLARLYQPFSYYSVTVGLVAISVLCFLAPWMTPKDAKGYQFLLRQTRINQPENQIALYMIEPSTYREVRIQVFLAAVFLTICLLHGLFGFFRTSRYGALVSKLRLWASYLMLLISGNYLLHLAVLLYESERPTPRAVLDFVFPASGITGPRGYPMLFYDPAYGFWVFLGCILLLACMSLKQPAAVGERMTR